MPDNLKILTAKAAEFDINLSERQTEQFAKYLEFLFEYNKHTNLVSSAEFDTVILKHFADSLSAGLLQKQLKLNKPGIFSDIGIGGGFPGVPLLIAFPELKLCAVDSVRKKTDFLKQLSEIIGIKDRIEIINARAEELKNKKRSFDFAVSRAVGKLNVLAEYSLPFIKIGGFFVAYKAKNCREEIKEAKTALKILGGEVAEILNYTLSGEERNLILIKKINITPEKYPRKPGMPRKNPL